MRHLASFTRTKNSKALSWREMSEVSLVKIHFAKIFGVVLHNRKKYLASLPKVYRWIAGINQSLDHSYPIQINAGMAKRYKTEEIAALMRLYRNKATKTNNTDECSAGNHTGMSWS